MRGTTRVVKQTCSAFFVQIVGIVTTLQIVGIVTTLRSGNDDNLFALLDEILAKQLNKEVI